MAFSRTCWLCCKVACIDVFGKPVGDFYNAVIFRDCMCMCGSNEDGLQDIVILNERSEHIPLIEIRIKECQGSAIVR